MKILILGGTGVISQEIVTQAIVAGFEVLTFNRGLRQSANSPLLQTIIGDRRDKMDFIKKMKDIKVDVVIDMISFNEADARQTVEIFADKAQQIIFTSSIAAYKRPYASFPVREEQEMLWDNPDFSYAFHKSEMERYLQTVIAGQKIPITIIRPSLTFGIGAQNIGVLRQNYNIVSRMKAHKPLVLIGEGTIPWSFTFTEDLAKGFVLSCGNPSTYNEAFHVTNSQVVLWEDLYHTIGNIIGEKPSFAYIPSEILKNALPDLCGHFYYEKKYCSVFDNSKFQKAVPAYKPTVTLEKGMGKIVEWWTHEQHTLDIEKDILEDRLCACYHDFAQSVTTLHPPVL
jgi:nucleoside-diphosphate-sugar epimerase